MIPEAQFPMKSCALKVLHRSLAGLLLFVLLGATATAQEPAPTPLFRPAPQASPVMSPTPQVSPELVPAPVVPAQYANPAATLRTFTLAMASSYPYSVPEEALDCLDLSEAPNLIRGTAGPQTAIKLYEVLITANFNKTAVPRSPDGETYILYRQPNGDRIALSKGGDGYWRFDTKTVLTAAKMNEILVKKGSLETWLAPYFNKKFLGLYLLQWGLAILPALLAYFVGRLILGVLRFFARRKYTRIDNWAPVGILRGFPWFLSSAFFLGFLGYLDLPLKHLVIFTAIGKLYATVSAVWFCFGLIDLAQASVPRFSVYKKVGLHNAILPMLARTMKFLVGFLGLLFFAQNLNINVWSLFAGFSVVGAMIALAGQDFVKNLFGSITVVLDQPFDVGDWISIDGVDGTVEDVGFRSTKIRTFYNSVITLPNSLMLTAKVDNYGARKYRRYSQNLHISQRTPQPLIESFCEGIRELVRRHPYTRKDYFHVVLNDVTPDALKILVYVFWETPDWSTELLERHRFLSDVLLLGARLGVEMAPGMTRVQLTKWTPTEASEELYSSQIHTQALEEGASQAREVVNATLPDVPTPDSAVAEQD